MVRFENGKAVGMEGKVIHTLNKSEVSLPDSLKKLVEKRTEIILLGDQLSDLDMVTDKTKNITKVAFYTKDNKENLNEYYDIVLKEDENYNDLRKKLFEST